MKAILLTVGLMMLAGCGREVPAGESKATSGQATEQNSKPHLAAPPAPGGPGERLLPRVRQLEEQLRQFKNKNHNRSKE